MFEVEEQFGCIHDDERSERFDQSRGSALGCGFKKLQQDMSESERCRDTGMFSLAILAEYDTGVANGESLACMCK